MAAHYFGYMENNVTGRPVAGGTVKVYDSAPSNGGSLVSIYTDEALSDAIDQTSSPLTTDQYGYYEFYTSAAEGYLVYLYNGETKKEIDNVAFIGGTVSTDYTALAARVDKHDTVFGLSASATSLGTFTGSTITDNTSVKVALQELETAVELVNDNLADPDADRILFWDDSAGAKAWLTASTGLTITGTDLTVDQTALTSVKPLESITLACSDETTAISATGTVLTFRVPYAFTLTEVRASLNTACTTGTFTVDINEGGTTILSTKLTIDATEKTSTTAATAAVISDSALADDAEITVDIDDVGDSTATGMKVTLIGRRT